MATMVGEPYVHCVPIMTGGSGGEEVRRFYSEHFVNQIPKDAEVTPISRTIGKDQVVDELIVKFTHDTQWDYLLPGIPPTGKRVEIPHAVVMKFENGKVAHEHVWWDQASRSERLRHPAANRHSMPYTSHAPKNRPSNKDLKDWFAECCDQPSNSCVHDRCTTFQEPHKS
jgi:hypothetical protein